MSIFTKLYFILLLVGLTVVSLYLDLVLIQLATETGKAQKELTMNIPSNPDVYKPIESYSFISDDYPISLPLNASAVKLELEESVHYSLINPEAMDEWLWTAPLGDNHIRLGHSRRMFAVAYFHQMHCLRNIREEISKEYANGVKEHLHHCFNYLRQSMLCAADTTLEPGDFKKRNFTLNNVRTTHTCRDWKPMYDMADGNWIEWEKYRNRILEKEHNDV
ncbi:hypothetical protein BU17DRAFT_68833 [Hysterangium stoloniferum]|nr:hypothetical protein BU17DRAFT_68833 [Hysterangium stoloniferum]